MLNKNPTPGKTPDSLEEVADSQRQIARLIREVRGYRDAYQAAIKPLTEGLEKDTAPRIKEILERAKAIRRYAESHKTQLLGNSRRKSVEVQNGGMLEWYLTNPSVEIKAEDEPHIIALIKQMDLGKFIRLVESLDRQAMLRDPDTAKTIPGVTIRGGKRFAIRAQGEEKSPVIYHVRQRKWEVPKG